MIKGMHHVGISVADMDRSIEFYRSMFEMELVVPPVPFGGPNFEQVMAVKDAQGRMCILGRGSLQLELFEFAQPRPVAKDPRYPVSDQGITHFGVEVLDIDATYEKLHAAGVQFHCPVTEFQGGVRAAYGRDPDGNVFELLSFPDSAH